MNPEAPAIVQFSPMIVLPAMPTQAAMAVFANFAVVSNHDLVVNFHAVSNPSVVYGASIDGGIGSDFDVSADPNSTQLMNFSPSLVSSVRNQSHPRQLQPPNDPAAFTQSNTVIQTDVARNLTVSTNFDAITDPSIGSDSNL